MLLNPSYDLFLVVHSVILVYANKCVNFSLEE